LKKNAVGFCFILFKNFYQTQKILRAGEGEGVSLIKMDYHDPDFDSNLLESRSSGVRVGEGEGELQRLFQATYDDLFDPCLTL